MECGKLSQSSFKLSAVTKLLSLAKSASEIISARRLGSIPKALIASSSMSFFKVFDLSFDFDNLPFKNSS
jgi:hypothetical protein